MPLTASYHVMLREGLPQLEHELLERYCLRLEGRGGRMLLYFKCTRINTSHPAFLEMETFRPPEDETFPVKIPYHYVMMITGDAERPSIGFLPGD